MQIQWHGLGCFTITGKPVAGEVSVVTDPYNDVAGLKAPRTLKGSMVISSSDDKMANNSKNVLGEEEKKKPFSIEHAGEYEVKGVFATGIHAPKKDGTAHTIYRISAEGISIGFLGSLDRKLKETEVERLGDIHILIIPVGGQSVLSAEDAAATVAQIEPRIVIPSYHSIDTFADEKAFCKSLACPVDEQVKLKIKKSGLPTDDIQLIVLKKS